MLFGHVDLSHLTEGGWFSLPRILPVSPVFRLDAIISICIVYLVSATETIGDTSAIAGGALHRPVEPRELSGALTVDGFGSAVGSLFGVTPVTSYSENVGLTIMTGVVNRNVARIGALIMVLCGLFPPVGQFVRSVPAPVIGGVLLIVIGQILVSGFQMIAEAGFTERNKLIASVSLAMGIGFTASTEAGIWEHFSCHRADYLWPERRFCHICRCTAPESAAAETSQGITGSSPGSFSPVFFCPSAIRRSISAAYLPASTGS